jgi:hypothetical protein
MLLFFIIILFVIITVCLIYANRKDKKKGWTCKEGGCEEMLGGEYKDILECELDCKKKVKFSDKVEKSKEIIITSSSDLPSNSEDSVNFEEE